MAARAPVFRLLRSWQPCAPTTAARAPLYGLRSIHNTAAARAAKSTAQCSNKPGEQTPPPRRASNITILFYIGAFLACAAFQPYTLFREDQRTGLRDRDAKAVPTDVTQDGKGHNERETRFIRLAEVRQHDGTSERPWVTRGDSVYDITDWVQVHPGGDVILRAAGGSIDPYWDIFSIHKAQYVYDILDQYRIGKVDPADLVDGAMPQDAIEDPFAADPDRDAQLLTLTARPRCAETPGHALAGFLTHNKVFYVRNHMWVPVINKSDYQLTIELSNGEEKVYTLSDLKTRFPQYRVTATLQCAGNRRRHMTEHARKTNGLQWNVGAISNAEWEGVRLRDILADAGYGVDRLTTADDEVQHAHFIAYEAYGASIPIEKAVDPRGDVLLALRMNGEDLPPDHGYPVRVVVPGNVAARSVKWLKRVVLSDEESPSQWQRRDYKCFGPNVTNPDWTKGTSIQETPITSAITSITRRLGNISAGLVNVDMEGYAFSGGGRGVIRVDVSMDDGKTWDQAELLDDKAEGSKVWCWRRWRYSGQVQGTGKSTLIVKATDEAYNAQPETHSAIFNPRGNLATAWHRISYESDTMPVDSTGKK